MADGPGHQSQGGASGARSAGRRRSAAWSISALFALLTLVPLAILAYATLTLSARAVEREVRAKVQASAILEARAVTVRLDGIRGLVVSLSQRSKVVAALGDGSPASRDLPGLQATLDEFAHADPGFGFAAVVDPSGRAIAGSPEVPANIGQDFSHRDWYRGVARTGQPYVSEAYQAAAPGQPLAVAVAVPISAAGPGASPPLLGYLTVGYLLDSVQEFVRSFERGQDVALTVTDQRGVILAAPGERSGLVEAGGDVAVRRALAGESGTASLDRPGGRVLAGFVPIPDLGWTVHADVPESEAFASVTGLRKAVGVIAGGLAAALLVGSVLMGRVWRARAVAEAELARRAQELERANADLARSNDELEQFAYVASHDLSEPLRAISGPISLLARRYHEQLDDDADQFISFAVDGCQRMQAMIDDLLVYSRVGRLERRLEPTDCNRVVDSVLTALGPTIAETGAVVDVGPLPVVRAEPTQLGQVFQNLIRNSVKFVTPGQTPQVSVAAEREDGEWRFTVTDNGIGIDPAHRGRIFEMFKRLHSRDDYPGTGIGLALAKKIVQRHGGCIGVEDAPAGAGSRFWFTLPAEEAR